MQQYHSLLLSLLLEKTGKRRRRKGGREGGRKGLDDEADRLAFLLGYIHQGPPSRGR
jgi:hypothetical protein